MSIAADNIPQIRDWTIYKITNPSDKIYIGKSYNFNGRMTNYRNLGGRCSKQSLLFNSLLKYSFANHKVDIVEQFHSDLSYANGKEIFWIRSEMSNYRKWRDGNGLNLTDGGEGAPGAKFPNRVGYWKGKHLPEETKKRISETLMASDAPNPMKGVKMSDESKKKMSVAKNGTVSAFKGKRHSTETILRQSAKRLGKKKPHLVGRSNKRTIIKSTSKQAVMLFSEDNVFIRELNSKRDASKVLNVGKGLTDNLLKGFMEGKCNGFIIKLKNK